MNRLPLIPIVAAFVLSCEEPGSKDSADDTSLDTEDSADTGDTETGDTSEDSDSGELHDPERWLINADWNRALSVPADRGLSWAMDESFSIDDASVPSILVLHEGGGYRMFLTFHDQHGRIAMLHSDDALEWGDRVDEVLHTDLLDIEGGLLTDAAPIYLDDGSYRVFAEAYDSGNNETEVRAVRTRDGETFQYEKGVLFNPSKNDQQITSVLGPLWYEPSNAWFIYYVGNWAGKDGDGIRLQSSSDGESFSPLVTENILHKGDVDPNPVRVEGGGIRLYHTSGRPDGQPGLATSADGLVFEDQGPMSSFDGSTCDPTLMVVGDRCLLDPFFLRLPDDRLLLYFTQIEKQETTQTYSVRRAFSTD